MIKPLLVSLLLQWTIPMHTAAPLGSSGGTITRVNETMTGNQTIASEATATTITSTTAGNFLSVLVAVKSGLIATVTANPGSHALTQAGLLTPGARAAIGFWYLPNIPASITSIAVTYTSSNGNLATVSAAEYSGLSTSAAIVNTFVTCSSAFTTSAFTCGPYTVTTGNLLVGGCSAPASQAAAVFTPGTGWTTTGTWTTPGTDTTSWAIEQLGPAAGAYSTNGTLSTGATLGQTYDCIIGSFK